MRPSILTENIPSLFVLFSFQEKQGQNMAFSKMVKQVLK